MTGVFSSSGGVGVTTLAIGLAMALAENSAKRVLLLELDTRPSDIMTFLDIRPPYSVADALHNIDRMDESFIQGLVVKYDNGLFVLVGIAGSGCVKADRPFPLLDGRNVAGLDEDDLGSGVEEALDQPGRRGAVDVDPLARDPFHGQIVSAAIKDMSAGRKRPADFTQTILAGAFLTRA